jgi:hypothetical protein
MAFRSFEREVVTALVSSHLQADELQDVLDNAIEVSFEQTGVGYFLTVAHPMLPQERVVCSEPLIVATSGRTECGFVVFVENGELTLECHSWNAEPVPLDFREGNVQIGS